MNRPRVSDKVNASTPVSKNSTSAYLVLLNNSWVVVVSSMAKENLGHNVLSLLEYTAAVVGELIQGQFLAVIEPDSSLFCLAAIGSLCTARCLDF